MHLRLQPRGARRNSVLLAILALTLSATTTTTARAVPPRLDAAADVVQTAQLSMPATATAYSDVTATATFTPADVGRPARIQQKNGSSWIDVANGTEDAAGQVALTVNVGGVGANQFRARAEFFNGTPSVVSPVVTVDVQEPDFEAPGPVTDPRISAATGTSLTLSWTNPGDADFAGVMIRRKNGTIPPNAPDQGTLVVDTAAPATSYVDTGLTAGKTYSYALFAHDEVPNYAAQDSLTGVTDNGAPSTTGDWPQGRQGPEHRGWSPNERVLRPSNVGSIDEEWSTTETGTPVIAGTTLFVSGSDPDGSAQLKAYNLTTGGALWRKATDSCTGQPALTPTMIVLNCGSSIRAYQRGGAHDLLWDTADTDPGQSFSDQLFLGDTVVGWSADRVVAYRLSDGQRKWQQLIPSGASNIVDVAASADRVVVAYGNRLRALALTNGAQLWIDTVTANDVLVADGWAYTQGDGSVRRFALADGAPGWSASPEHGVYRLLAADNDTVYVWSAVFDFGPPSPSILRALRVSDGSQKWSYDVPSRVGTVAVAGSLVWVTSSDIYSQGRSSDLIALNRTDGAELRQVHFDDNMYSGYSSVAFGGGKVAFDQGGSFGEPAPHRLRVWGIGGRVPDITTNVLPIGRVGSPYSFDLATVAAPGPISWSVTGGSLPAGLTLSTTGHLSGTPTTAGSSQVTIRATSSNGRTDEVSFPLQVVPATSATNWFMGGMARARNPFSPGTGALDITESATFGFRWKTADGADPTGLAANVAINGNRFYTVAGNGRLKSYDITGSTANRAPKWSSSAGGTNAFAGPVTLADGILMVRDYQYNRLWAFRASDGVKLWWTGTYVASPYTPPVVVGDTVVVGDQSGQLRAYSLADGTRRWKGTLTGRAGWSELSTDGARIYGVADCTLYALDATNGTELWHTSTLTPGGDSCSDELYPPVAPIVTGNRVYATEPFSKLVVSSATGAVIERFRAYNILGGGSVVVGGIWIYPDDGIIVARDTTTGRRVWQTPFPPNIGSTASLVATGDLLIASGQYGIAGLDRLTGDLIWDGGSVDSGYGNRRESVAIGQDRILVATPTGVRAYGPL